MLENVFQFDFKTLTPEFVENQVTEIRKLLLISNCGIKEIKTKLEILNDEFQMMKQRNPIEHMQYRVKSPESIARKLKKKGLPVTAAAAAAELNDIAGIRVVCSFVDDIYHVAQMLTKQDDITVILEKDYIKNPKPNGYRSYHIVLEVPIFFSNRTIPARVEVQIRTIAMDFWASLEHKLFYKVGKDAGSAEIYKRLSQCAQVIAKTDEEMQNIRTMVEHLN